MNMKKNELKELLALGNKAISGKIAELEARLDNFSLELKRGQIKNVREGKSIRLVIAKLKTHMSLLKGDK